MEILTAQDSTLVTDIHYTYPLGYSAKCLKGAYRHEDLATFIHENNLSTHMVIVVSELLAAEHWDDPEYIHKTNTLGISVVEEQARNELTNKYYNQEAIDELIKRKEFPTWRYNYKDPDNERKFKFVIEDALFEYQIKRKIQDLIPQALEMAHYKSNEEGWPIEDEEGEYLIETDHRVIEKRKDAILEALIAPRVFTSSERVYNMPQPLCHWDYRSKWHQFFFVDVPEEGITVYGRGHNGSSGSREANGRWAHAFAHLEEIFGVGTPTYILRYDKHNKLHLKEYSTSFKVLDTDLSGNYPSDTATLHSLFRDRELSVMEYAYGID